MKLISGYPFGLIKNGLPYQYPSLEADAKADVVIMGGGISGALTAYYLINAGVDCLLVDRRSIGLGSTCASTSLLQYEIDVSLSELSGMIGEQNAVTAYKLCEAAIGKIAAIEKATGSIAFEEKNSLYYAAAKSDRKFLKEEYAIRKANGFEVAYLERKDIKANYGFDAPAAILSATAGQTDAYALTHAILQYCIKKGMLVYDRTQLETIKHETGRVVMKTARGNSIIAGKLVYANGYESVQYIDKKIVDLQHTYAIVSEQLTESTPLWKDDLLIWNTADPYLYMRTTKDKRIIVGGRDEKFRNPVRRDKLIEKKSAELARDFHKLFPGIPFEAEFKWTGTFGSTKDGLPFIGPYAKKPNSLFALGFGGNGITFSLIAAEIIRDIITKNEQPHRALFSFERV